MAEYFTHFSTTLDVGGPENITKAQDLLDSLFETDEETYSGFKTASIEVKGKPILWIYDNDSYGNPEAVIEFVLKLSEHLDLKGTWGFDFAYTCSKSQIDAFGGGAVAIDLEEREVIAQIDTKTWLTQNTQ
jgi:hypothetical protein